MFSECLESYVPLFPIERAFPNFQGSDERATDCDGTIHAAHQTFALNHDKLNTSIYSTTRTAKFRVVASIIDRENSTVVPQMTLLRPLQREFLREFAYNVCSTAPFSRYTIVPRGEGWGWSFGAASWETGKFVGNMISLRESGVFPAALYFIVDYIKRSNKRALVVPAAPSDGASIQPASKHDLSSQLQQIMKPRKNQHLD